MSDEYDTLRAEMLKWQDRRFDLLKISIGLVTALLGLKLVVEHPSKGEIWPLVSSVLLLYLSGANLLTWYAGVANSKLAAYIKVFHESDDGTVPGYRWENRLQRLKEKGLDPQNLNIWITVVYLALAVLSVAIPYATSGSSHSGPGIHSVLPVAGLLFIASAILVVCFSYPRKRYENHWDEIKKEEKGPA
jgi:hypothetical protein